MRRELRRATLLSLLSESLAEVWGGVGASGPRRVRVALAAALDSQLHTLPLTQRAGTPLAFVLVICNEVLSSTKFYDRVNPKPFVTVQLAVAQ